MCLIVAAWQVHPEFPLVLAANRDEFHARPAAPAGAWDSPAGLYGGRDLEAGGTWLATDAHGRVAAVTNVRESVADTDGKRSRGELPVSFLTGGASAADAAATLHARGDDYRGFNLLLVDDDALRLVSNRHPEVLSLDAGLHAVSNACPGEDWPKAVRARTALAAALDRNGDPKPLVDAAFALLASGDTDNGDPLSAIFVTGERYGTRASTVILRTRDGVLHFHERRFGPSARPAGDADFTLPRHAA